MHNDAFLTLEWLSVRASEHAARNDINLNSHGYLVAMDTVRAVLHARMQGQGTVTVCRNPAHVREHNDLSTVELEPDPVEDVFHHVRADLAWLRQITPATRECVGLGRSEWGEWRRAVDDLLGAVATAYLRYLRNRDEEVDQR